MYDCKGPNSSLADIVLFQLSRKVFKTHLLGRGFHTLIKNASFSSTIDVRSHNSPPLGPSILTGTHSLLQLMWDPPIHPPFQGPTSLLAHRLVSTPLRRSSSSQAHHPMSSSDIICNSPSPQITDIVLFGLSLSSFPSMFLKRVY